METYWLDSNGRRNTLKGGVAMRKHRRRSDRSGRALLFSPGRPVVAGRDEQRRFWAAIAAGMASEWGKPSFLPRTSAGFTVAALMDMDFATSCPLVRPLLPH